MIMADDKISRTYIDDLTNYYGVQNNNKQKYNSSHNKINNPLNQCSGITLLSAFSIFIQFLLIPILISIGLIVVLGIHSYVSNPAPVIWVISNASTETFKLLDQFHRYTQSVISPKIDLINTMVGFTIPSQITQTKKEILDDIRIRCAPTFEYKNNTCPTIPEPSHSIHYKEFNPDRITRCLQLGFEVQLLHTLEPVEAPSFVPGPTTTKGCIRLPSFVIGEHVWGYTHNVIRRGCSDRSLSDQYLSVGVIHDGENDIPYFKTVQSWYISDNINRKSCSVAPSNHGVWMGCTIVTVHEINDYCNKGAGLIMIQYLDVFGKRRSWTYTTSEIDIYPYFNSLYFAVGSGVLVDGRVYFVMYGALTNETRIPCFCRAPGCTNLDTNICDSTCKPGIFCRKQVVLILVTFDDSITNKPRLHFAVVNPRSIWVGAEARLIHNSYLDITYLYVRSAGWHVYPQVALINIKDPKQIVWVMHTGISRPGYSPCGADNRCPRDCISGVYNDIFPLGRYYEFGISVYLRSTHHRKNPTIVILNTTNIISELSLRSPNQEAYYSTTTCFNYRRQPWCISIIEFTPAAVGEVIPVPLTYKLPLRCVSPILSKGQAVIDIRSQVSLVVPSMNNIQGEETVLTELSRNWDAFMQSLPPLFYKEGFPIVESNLFKHDPLIYRQDENQIASRTTPKTVINIIESSGSAAQQHTTRQKRSTQRNKISIGIDKQDELELQLIFAANQAMLPNFGNSSNILTFG
nr:receptor binding protein [Paramyxoviridae sp.]